MERTLRISDSDAKLIFEKIGVKVTEVERHFISKKMNFVAAEGRDVDRDYDLDIPPGFSRIARIGIYNDISDVNNHNMMITRPIEIDGKEVVSEGFPTRLLFPKFGNEMYTDIDFELDGMKSKLNCQLRDTYFTKGGVESYDCYIFLMLEKDKAP